jgi:predicted dehydrogenase
MAMAAIENGKHVLCEKPLARTPRECAGVVRAAEQAGRLLATGFNYRFYPSIEQARVSLESGAIGDLDHVRAFAGYSAHSHTRAWLHEPGVTGGGALWDNGIHLIDLVRSFLGDVEELAGCASSNVWRFEGCEDNGFALLRSAKGKLASLQASWTEWGRYRFEIEICGTHGSIRASCFPMFTQVVRISEGRPTPIRRRYLFPKTHLMEHLRSYRWVVTGSFVKEFRAFEAALRGERTALASGRDGMMAVVIAYAAAHGRLGKLDVPAG